MKRYLVALASLLVLCLIWGLQTRDASGQAGTRFVAICEGVGTDGEFQGLAGTLAITQDGEVYFRPSGSPHGFRWIHESSIGATGVVAMSSGPGQDGTRGVRVFCSDGSVHFRRNAMGAQWVNDSSIGSDQIAAVGYGPSTALYTGDLALTQDGIVYVRPDAYPCCNHWQLDSNIIEQATPTTRATWGQLKARYK